LLFRSKIKLQFAKQSWPGPLRWRTRAVERMLDRIAQPNRISPPPMPEDVRASLLTDYHDDILKLSDLLHRDLTHWCSPVAMAAAENAG
jgi:hypothetical protein